MDADGTPARVGPGRADPAGRATLARVAREASVSTSTVSKVLNGRGGVSAATRERVERLLQTHGYRRRGDETPSPLIELVLGALDSGWALLVLTGVERAAARHGMSVVVTLRGDDRASGSGWIDGVLTRRPAGVVLALSDIDAEHGRRLRTRGIPFVLVDPSGEPAEGVASVGAANWAGGVAAVRHLLGEGHTRIGVVTGPLEVLCSRARLSGFRSALEEAGLPLAPELVVRGAGFDIGDGAVAAEALLALREPPTAIVASSDLQALGVYEAAQSRGLVVPRDLSVVGFDDLPFVRWLGPPLTTVRQPVVEMAETAVRLLLEDRDDAAPAHLDLATRLVVRGSTARPVR